MKSSKQFRNIVRNHDGAIAYQVDGRSSVYRALPKNPANDKLHAAHRALVARREQLKKEAETPVVNSAAKPELNTQSDAPPPEKKPWWKRFLEYFLGVDQDKHPSRVADPNIAMAPPPSSSEPAEAAARQENDPMSVAPAPSQHLSSASRTVPDAKAQEHPSAPPVLHEPAGATLAPGSETLFKSIEPTSTGYRIVFPDGFEMEVPENSHEGQVLSAALEEAEKIVVRADLAIAELDHANPAKNRPNRPSSTLVGVEGVIQEMPPAASGIRRFGVDLEDGKWVALNPSPRERKMLSDLADKGSLGKVQVAVSDLTVAIKAIELDSKMVSMDDLNRGAHPTQVPLSDASPEVPEKPSSPEGELPPETTEPESIGGPVEDLPVVPSSAPKAPEPIADVECEDPLKPRAPDHVEAAQPAEPESAPIHSEAPAESPVETDIFVAQLHNIDQNGGIETCLITDGGVAFRVYVGSEEAKEKLRAAAEVAPISIGVRFDDNHLPVPVCVMEQGPDGQPDTKVVPSFESVFGPVEKIEKHPDPEVQSAFSSFAGSLKPTAPVPTTPAQSEAGEPDAFHHYRSPAASEPDIDR